MGLRAGGRGGVWLELIERVGFPAVVAFYVLFTLSADVRQLIEVERAQTAMLSRLVEQQILAREPTPRPAGRPLPVGGHVQ